MKLRIFFIVFLVCLGQIVTVRAQTNPERFLIGNIVLVTDYTPRFIWRIANMIRWRDDITTEDVSCVKTELMKTGVFKSIQTRLVWLEESGAFELVITP